MNVAQEYILFKLTHFHLTKADDDCVNARYFVPIVSCVYCASCHVWLSRLDGNFLSFCVGLCEMYI